MDNEIKKLFLNSKNLTSKWSNYFNVYEDLFKKFRNKDITFVEIGIHNGGSLEIWRKYFTKNSKIIGIDINPECKKFEKKNENVEVYIGNQSDKNFWNDFFQKVGPVDVILDDGGHTNLDQIITTVNTVRNIKDGGILLVEDVHTSYISEYNSSLKHSFINFSKKIINDINFNNEKKLGDYKFSLNNYIYSIQYFESFVVFYIDRSKTKINIPLKNQGIDHKITDLTWSGNEINIEGIKSNFKKIPFIRLNKLLKLIKNKINDRYIKKYFR